MALTATTPSGGEDILATWGAAVVTDLAFLYANSSPIGSITMWAGDSGSLPDNWKLCDGSEIDQTTYATLYAVIGDTFNDSPAVGNFNLPDMRDRFVVGAGSSYARNAKGGAISNAHTHSVTSNVSVGNHSSLSHSGVTASFNKNVMNSNQSAHAHTDGTLTAALQITGSKTYANLRNYSWTSDRYYYLYSGEVASSTGVSTGVIVYGTTDGANAVWNSSTVSCSVTQPATHSISSHSVSNPAVTSGAASANENRPPYIGMLYIIKYQ